MTTEEFVKQQIKVGYKIHFNNGVWWQESAPFFYKPVNFFQKLQPGESKPKRLKSFLGYSHLVKDKQMANKYWSVLSLQEKRLKEFSISSLSSSKRAQVRKGLKLTEIRKIESIEPLIEDMKNINISAAIRTNHGKPAEYYSNSFEKWKSLIIRAFNLTKGEWWGSFYQDVLIAYIYAIHIDDIMYISAAKSHTDTLNKCPNDSLIFSFLDYCKNLNDCKRVIYGDWSEDAPSLNEFKRKYGFEKEDLSVYVAFNPLISLVKKIKRLSP